MQTNVKGATVRFQPEIAMDAEGVRALRPRLEGLVASPRGDVELDLSSVSEIDGSGLGAIAFLHKRLAMRGHRLTVTGASGQPREVLSRFGLDRVLTQAAPAVRRPAWHQQVLSMAQ